jgi:hypothetical protein
LIDLTSPTLTVLFAGLTLGSTYLSYVSAEHPSNIRNDSTLYRAIATDSTVVASDVEDTAMTEVQGEANVKPRLTIDNDFVDPENHCDFCSRIEYEPGKEHKAGVAYRNDTLDWNDTKRIVFFAKGEKGGENVSFLAAGKSTDDFKSNDTDIFPNIVFLVTTEKIVLDDQWKRYEITLNNIPLMHSTYPFGFQITENTSNAKMVFYVKGVTLDRQSAKNPLGKAIPTGNSK